MGVLIGSAVIPVALAVTWTRLTGNGMIAGAITGTVSALIAWLITASTMDGGLGNFFDSTGMVVQEIRYHWLLKHISVRREKM